MKYIHIPWTLDIKCVRYPVKKYLYPVASYIRFSRSAYHGVVKVEVDLAAAGLVVGLRDGQHVQVPPLPSYLY